MRPYAICHTFVPPRLVIRDDGWCRIYCRPPGRIISVAGVPVEEIPDVQLSVSVVLREAVLSFPIKNGVTEADFQLVCLV